MKKRIALLLAIVMLIGVLPMNLMAGAPPLHPVLSRANINLPGGVPSYTQWQVFADGQLGLPPTTTGVSNVFAGGAGTATRFIANQGGGMNLVVGFHSAAQGQQIHVHLDNAIWAFHETFMGGTLHSDVNRGAAGNFVVVNPTGGHINEFTTIGGQYKDVQAYTPTVGHWTGTGVDVVQGASLTDFTWTRVGSNFAVITIEENVGEGYIVLPLAIMATHAENLIGVRVTGHVPNFPVQFSPIPNREAIDVGRAVPSLVGAPISAARGRVYVPAIRITETTANVLINGWMAIVPPRGFNLLVANSIDPITQRNAAGNYVGVASQLNLVQGPGIVTRPAGIYQGAWDGVRSSGHASFTFTETWDNVRQRGQLVYLNVPASPRAHPGWIEIPADTFVLQTIEHVEVPFFTDDVLNLRIMDWFNVGQNTTARTGGPGNHDFRSIENIQAYDAGGAAIALPRVDVGAGPDIMVWRQWTADDAVRWAGDVAFANVVVGSWGWWPTPAGGAVTAQARPGIWPTSVGVVEQREWDILFSAADPVNMWAGRTDQLAARLTITANTIGSWQLSRDTVLTLVDSAGNEREDVRITRVVVPDGTVPGGRRAVQAGGVGLNNFTFWNRAAAGGTNPEWYAHGLFGRNGNTFILRDLAPQTVTNFLPQMHLDFRLSISPDFDFSNPGIYVRIEGGGIEDTFNVVNINQSQVQIATAHRPFDVDFETTVVQIGYLIYEVGDIIITENYVTGLARPIRNNDALVLGVGAFGRTTLRAGDYMGFNPIARAQVNAHSTDGRFRVTDVRTTPHGDIRLSVAEEARTTGVGGVIELTDLTLDISRNVPEGRYELIVTLEGAPGRFTPNTIPPGDMNVLWLFDRFPLDGFRFADYVVMGTPGAHRPFIREVRVRPNDYVAIVNDREIPMDAPPLFFGDRVYVPIRFISQILGVDPANVRWDQYLQQVSIVTAERNITFTYGSHLYTVNGITHSMTWLDDWGVMQMAVPQFADEWQVMQHPSAQFRIYVPVRFIAYALGIEQVDWTGGEVIFNPVNVLVAEEYADYFND